METFWSTDVSDIISLSTVIPQEKICSGFTSMDKSQEISSILGIVLTQPLKSVLTIKKLNQVMLTDA